MIQLHTDLGDYEFTVDENSTTPQDLVQHLKDQLKIHIRGSWVMQETLSGRVLSTSEKLVDGRLYWLSAGLFTE